MVWIIESWQTKMKAKKWTLKWKSLENMSIGRINNKSLPIHTMNTATKNEAVLYTTITLRNFQGILSCEEKTSCWKCVCFVVVWSLSHVQLFCNPMGLSAARPLCPWDFPGNNTGGGWLFSRGSSQLRDWTGISRLAEASLPLWHLGSPVIPFSYLPSELIPNSKRKAKKI